MNAEADPSAPSDAPRDLDQEQARLAYSIIESLLEHTRVVSDLIALMAQTLDQDTTKHSPRLPSGQPILIAVVPWNELASMWKNLLRL